MRYFANYEADAVIREDDGGKRYIKRIERLREVQVEDGCKEAYGIPSFGCFNLLKPITKEEYQNFGKTWDWDPSTGERRSLVEK